MARSTKASKPARSKPRKPQPVVEDPPPGNIWLDDLAGFWLRFEKFGWDVLGVGLLESAYASALARGRAVRMALDQVLSDEAAALRDGAEVAFFPPVTGG